MFTFFDLFCVFFFILFQKNDAVCILRISAGVSVKTQSTFASRPSLGLGTAKADDHVSR